MVKLASFWVLIAIIITLSAYALNSYFRNHNSNSSQANQQANSIISSPKATEVKLNTAKSYIEISTIKLIVENPTDKILRDIKCDTCLVKDSSGAILSKPQINEIGGRRALRGLSEIRPNEKIEVTLTGIITISDKNKIDLDKSEFIITGQY